MKIWQYILVVLFCPYSLIWLWWNERGKWVAIIASLLIFSYTLVYIGYLVLLSIWGY